MERSEAINVLKTLQANCSKYFPEHQALELAIASLKTDDYFDAMSEDVEVYTKADVVAILTEIQLEIEDLPVHIVNNKGVIRMEIAPSAEDVSILIQEKIDLLQKQTTDNCDNCFNGTTKGGCAVKELMKNKDCKYYMPRKINEVTDNNE